jgi:hypothetical protein
MKKLTVDDSAHIKRAESVLEKMRESCDADEALGKFKMKCDGKSTSHGRLCAMLTRRTEVRLGEGAAPPHCNFTS